MSWPLVPLSLVAPAKPLKKVSAADDESVLQVTLDHVESNTGRLLTKKYLSIGEAGGSTHWFDEGHVLYSKLRPYLNKVYLPDERGIATTELVPMLPDPGRLDRKYLAYYLRSKSFVDWVSSQTAGAKMPRVSMKVFWDHCIPVPPLEEQKRIATILDKADSIRRKRQQAIQLADEFLRSVFLGMFGDPVTNPMGWGVGYLPDFGAFKNGLNYGRDESGTSMYCLGVGDFKSLDRIAGVTKLSTINLKTAPSEEYLLRDGDLVFVRSNGNKALVGRCLSVYPGQEKLTFSGFCIRFRVLQEGLDSEYLNFLFRMPSVRNEILKGGQGANIQNINQKKLSEIGIPIPPKGLQERFSSVVSAYKNMHSEINQCSHEIGELFASLSQKAFAGQL